MRAAADPAATRRPGVRRTPSPSRRPSARHTVRLLAASLAALLVGGLLQVAGADPALAAGALLCDQSTVYGIDNTGALKSIDVATGATTDIATMANNINGLGVSTGGGHAYAFSSGNGVNKIDDYNASTNAVTQIDTADAGVAPIRGAVDPKNGLFYYAVATTASASPTTTYLGAYDPATGTKYRQVAAIRVPSSGSGGDLAFSKSGVLYFLTGNLIYRVDGQVPESSGTAVLDSTLIATLSGITSSPGLAFASSGYLYASNGSTLRKIDPTSGTTVSSVTMTGSFSPNDLGSCNNPDTLRARVEVPDRVHPTDQWTVTLGGGSWPNPSATTTGTATGLQDASAGPVLALGGNNYTVTQTMASGSPGDYVTTYRCTADGVDLTSGSGSTATVTPPAGTTVNGSDIDCRFTNTPKTGTIAFGLALAAPRGSDSDQFVLSIRRDTDTGASYASTTTTGTGSTLTGGSGSTGATPVIAARTAVLTAEMASGSALTLARYDLTVTCSDANGLQTGLPSGAAYTGALSITPVAGAAITCTATATPDPATARAAVTLSDPRFDDGDQFTVTVATDGAPDRTATTTGSGSTVTSGTGTTAATTAPAGQTVRVSATASAHAARYAKTLTCTDANGFSTGLPNGAPLTGTGTFTAAAGADVSCTVAVSRAATALTVAIAPPASLDVNAPAAYAVTLGNDGGQPGTPTVQTRLPAGLAYVGVVGAGWSCTVTGTVGSGQLATCTGPSIAPGATGGYSLRVEPTPAIQGSSVVLAAAVDPAGGSAPADPSACTGGSPPAGCAVAAARTVGAGTSAARGAVTLGDARFDDGDQFTVTVRSDGVADQTATTSGSGSTVSAGSGTTGAVTVPGGQTVRILAVASAHALRYSMTLTCTDPTGYSGGLPNGAPFTGVASFTATAGADATCTVAVTHAARALTVAITPPGALDVNAPASYTVTVGNDGGQPGTPTVQHRLPAGLAYLGVDGAGWSCTVTGTIGSGQLATCTGPSVAPGATGGYALRVEPTDPLAGQSVVLAAAIDPAGGTAPADPAACTGSSPPAGCAVATARTVGAGSSTARAAVALGGTRFDDGDQFRVTLSVDGGAGSTGTTTGSGAAVTAGTGAVGPTTVAAGATIRVAATATAHPTRYLETLTCTDPSGFSSGLPSGVALTGTRSFPSVAGADVTCTVDVQRANPAFAVRIEAPGGLTVGVPASYAVAVDNDGGTAGTPTVAQRLPAGLAYRGVEGAGWSCTATGSVDAGQLVTCTGPSVVPAGTGAYALQVLPTGAIAGRGAVVAATVDRAGGTSPADPSGCTAASPPQGCAVAPSRVVDAGVALAVTATGPKALVRGVPAEYELRVTNGGTGAAPGATLLNRLPAGVRLLGATGGACTADRTLVRCVVDSAIEPGGSARVVLRVLPVDVRGSVVDVVTVDGSGGAQPAAPDRCASGSRTCDTAAATVSKPALTLAIALQSPTDHPVAGTVVRWVVTLTNTGPTTLDHVRLADGTTCAATVLKPGASTTCTTAPHTVTQAEVDAGRFRHVASASAKVAGCTADCTTASNTARASTPTRSVAALRLVQTARLTDANRNRRADVGETVVFHGRVTNTGTVRVSRLTVSGSLVDLVCARTSLAPGESTDCTGRRVVRSGDIVGGVLANTAVARAGGASAGSAVSLHRTATLAAGALPPALASTGLDLTLPIGAGGVLLLLALVGGVVLRRRAVLARRAARAG